MQLFSILWHRLSSIHLTISLCLLLVVDLIWGYFCLHRRTSLFVPLNDIGLVPWIRTYGSHDLPHTIWFFFLLALLALLAFNTFACTTGRVFHLVRARETGDRFRLLFKLSPHIMHYSLLVILVGYLCSYLFSQVLTSCTLVPGTYLSLPGTSGQVKFLAFEPTYYQGQRLDFWVGEVITAKARLQLDDGISQRETIISYTSPVRFMGYSLHLIDFAPKNLVGMNRKTRIDLQVRKDPGIALYLTGMLVFSLGLIIYVYERMICREANYS